MGAVSKDWLDRALDAAASSPGALAAADRLVALALAPVPPAPYFPPLPVEDREAATRSVQLWPVFCAPTGEDFAEHEHRATFGEHGNTGNDQAAMRAQLQGTPAMHGPFPWGGCEADDRVARVAALLSNGQTVILEGTWAAIRRAAPDRETVKSWQDAGAVEFPVLNLSEWGAGQVRWVPIDEVPFVGKRSRTT